jgi:hypothetical protein
MAMAKIRTAIVTLLVLLATGCGSSEPLPRTPFQKALARMPSMIMGLEMRPLKMKGFVFNNVAYTKDERRLVLQKIDREEPRLNWLLSMGHNIGSSVDRVLPLGKWNHTDLMNPTTWKWNIYDISNDHEVICSDANMDEFITWMTRHSFQILNRQYATVLQQVGRHVDADVFGSGVVIGPDGAVYIERQIPSDNTLDPAFRLYTGEGQSLMVVPEIYEVTSRLPENAFTSMVLKLDTSVSKHNQQSQEYWGGIPIGVPLEQEQTVSALNLGRPKSLTWMGVAHILRNGRHGLQFELLYSSEEDAKNDLVPLQIAIKESMGRFTKKNWWKEDLYLMEPEIKVDGKFISIWADFDIDEKWRDKIEKLDLTQKESEEAWLEQVRALFDFLDKLQRHDYGPFWTAE